MTDYTESSKEYWDEAISDDDRYTSVGVRALPESINRERKERLFDLIDQIGSEHLDGFENIAVLDAGCGTGIYSELYSDLGASVTGVDISDNAISLLKDSEIQGDFQQSRLDDLPFEDNNFDLTHSFSVLYHIVDDTEWMESLEELVRVTRPGGIILLRIAWQDNTEQSADHVKRRSKNKYQYLTKHSRLAVSEA
jgi:2-polyprenyl-3-methyl-5-hydroxy-6-metoxy-1,4-benzoquinol methylase